MLYGSAQTALGAVILLINAPVLLDSETRTSADPYSRFVVLLLLVAAFAIAWQVVRNAKSTFQRDDVQQKIHDDMNQAMKTGADSGTDQELM